jgi:hypothetical protein
MNKKLAVSVAAIDGRREKIAAPAGRAAHAPVRMRCSTTPNIAGSVTMPPLPTCPGCNSNCGFTSISTTPPGLSKGTAAGSTRVCEMKDRSPTIRSNWKPSPPVTSRGTLARSSRRDAGR